MKFVGVDGCRAGWLAVAVQRERVVQWMALPRFFDVLEAFPDLPVMVDIPIGLLDSGPAGRLCDIQARRLLRAPRASSVFPAPSRAALSAKSHLEAADANQAATGKRISRQTWAILPKIREVDDLLRRDARARRLVREVHPEVCFWGLNGGVPMTHNKRRPEGRLERRLTLARRCSNAAAFLDSAAREIKRSDAGLDDLHDALVAALTGAIGSQSGLQTLPDSPQRDAFGLPMEMCYVHPPSGT